VFSWDDDGWLKPLQTKRLCDEMLNSVWGWWVGGLFFSLFFAKGKFRGEEDDKEDNNFVVHSLLWCGLEEEKESERERDGSARVVKNQNLLSTTRGF
jgi:hypothetical protein